MSRTIPRGIKQCPVTFPEQIDPFVSNGLQDALGKDWLNSLDKAVASALKHNIYELIHWNIRNGTDFALFASGMLDWIPTENAGGKVVYDVLCLFYFVFDQPPVNLQQTKIDTTSIDKNLTPLSAWIVEFAKKMGDFMNKPASLTSDSVQSFVKSPLFHLDEAEKPAEEYKTFNQLFARNLKKGMRPISCPDDDRVIVYPADSTFDGAWSVTDTGNVNINTYDIQTATCKGIDWPISALLHKSQYADKFRGGIWMHAFLNTFDYHRQHAPVGGKVLEAKNVEGLAYLNVVPETVDGETHLRPHRNFKKQTFKEGEGAFDAPDDPGYQFLQMRASIIIHNDVVGHVAVLPIGMAQVSSVVINSNIIPTAGKTPTIKKGDEISHFEFGGSDIVLVFEKAAKVLITGAYTQLSGLDTKGQKYLVGEPLGIAGLGK